MASQRQDIFLPLAKRRHVNREHAETVIQVAAKPPGRYQGGERRVGGGDEPDIRESLAVAAERAIRAALQDAQERDLGTRRQAVDFVEEEGAVLGL